MAPARDAKRRLGSTTSGCAGYSTRALLLVCVGGFGLAQPITPWSTCAPAAFRWASDSGTRSPDSTSISTSSAIPRSPPTDARSGSDSSTPFWSPSSHSARHARGFRGRRRAAFAELAAVAACARLHQRPAQHAAAAAAAVLVQCGSQVAAGTPPVAELRRRRISQQPRPLPADAGPSGPGRLVRRRARWRP